MLQTSNKMAKKLTMKFTNFSMNNNNGNNVQHLNNNDSSLLGEQLTGSFDELNDESSVQLISVTDEDSENNSEYLADNCDNNKLDCNETQLKDDNDLLDGKNIGQKLDGKKKAGKKMDKLIKHLQEALLTPSLNSITVNNNNNNNNCTNHNDTSKMEQKNLKETADQHSEDQHSSPIHQPSAAISGASNTGKLSNISSNNWLNEIKLGNIVNLTKLSKPKQTTDTVTDSSVDGRRLSFAAGVKNQLVFSSIDQQSVMHSPETVNETKMNVNDNGLKHGSLSFTNLLTTTNETDMHFNDLDNNSIAANNNNKDKKKEMKSEQKKKFNLFDKKNFIKDDFKTNNLAKLVSPTKNSATTTTAATNNNNNNVASSIIVSPTGNFTNNTQVFSSFLSTLTNSTAKEKNSNNIGCVKSSSSENINVNGGDNNNSIVAAFAKNKSAKISSSKSMMAFRKATKFDNDNITYDDDPFSSFLSTTCSTQNPTLRRRDKSSCSPRRGSPAFEEINNCDNCNEELEFSQCSLKSSSPLPMAINQKLIEVNDKRLSLSTTNNNNNDNNCNNGTNNKLNSQHHRISLWNQMTSSNSLHYYILLFMTFLSVFFLCISPLPSFMNGFIFGFLMTFFIFTIAIVYLVANFFLIKTENKHRNNNNNNNPIETVGLKRNRSKRLAFNVSMINGDGAIYAGWVYEFIGDYVEREKNGFVSRLVYVVLSGSKLNIFVPSQEMNKKKLKNTADLNRNMPTCSFSLSAQRVIDFSQIQHKKIVLYLTKNVRNQRKYIWSKKYPICIEFNETVNNSVNKDDQLENNFGQYLPTPSSTPVISKLVIFARTCREKEEWFWAIKTSIDSTINYKNSNSNIDSNNSLSESPIDSKSYLFVTGNESQNSEMDLLNTQQQYLHILTRRLNYFNFMRTNILNAEGIGLGNPGMMTALTWFNVLLNRLSFDILNKPNWSAYIAKKLQRKLRRLRLPYFMESLMITEIDIGTTLPKFNSVPSVPSVDDAGLWIEFDLNYSGGFTMTLETKINLMKLFSNVENLTSDASPISTPNDSPKFTQKIGGRYWSGYRAKYRNAGTQSPGPGTDINEEFCDNDSDIDSIVTSSEDEEPETAPAAPDDADADEKQKKLVRFFEKIVSSQYFQKASQMNFVKKALEGVSNMSIMLTVQINSLNGTLAINIPEPPTDRLWYGFRNDPTIQISARPKLGDHDVNLSYVTNLIEKKLRTEFFNYFVIPNMDDFFIPALNTNIEQYINVVP